MQSGLRESIRLRFDFLLISSLRIYFGGHGKLKLLLEEAKTLYKSRVANRIRIWTAHQGK